MLLELLKLISAALFGLNERTKHPDSNQNHSTAAATITAVAVKVSYFVIRVSTKQDKVFSVVNTATHLLNHNILHNLFPARAQKTKSFQSFPVKGDQQVFSWYNMQEVRGCSFKMLAFTLGKKGNQEGRGDWKINGVCDWQLVILGISLNWITRRESASHNPWSAWDTLILNIQEHSPSVGYKAWSQNTVSPTENTAWRASNPNQLKHLKAASLFVPASKSWWLPRIRRQVVDRRWICTLVFLDFVYVIE